MLEMSTMTAAKTVTVLGEVFAHYRLPEQVVTDNGPQTTLCLLESWHIQCEQAPSQQREGHAARTLHHSAEVITNWHRLSIL